MTTASRPSSACRPASSYGTGIPACVLVCNKSKPNALKDKVLFINADREYAEGKNQNRLRPEDIEKIDFVFTHKRELPKYSRLVPKSEIVDTHDYNLNIRRYVDNTPDPEPEDVQAHLIGGIPEVEVAALTDDFAKFGLTSDLLFEPERPAYLAFRESIDARPAIRATLEASPALLGALTRHHDSLESWWAVARGDFAQLQHAGNGGKKMPEVRHELLTTLKAKLVPLGVLDEFKGAGVFVNWWQQIRFDLKTIVSTGWHHTLIPDEYLIAEYFQAEAGRHRRAGGDHRRSPGRAGRGRRDRPGGQRLRARRRREGHRSRIQEGSQGAHRRPERHHRRLRQKGAQEPDGPGQGHQGDREADQGRQGDAQGRGCRVGVQARTQAPRGRRLQGRDPGAGRAGRCPSRRAGPKEECRQEDHCRARQRTRRR